MIINLGRSRLRAVVAALAAAATFTLPGAAPAASADVRASLAVGRLDPPGGRDRRHRLFRYGKGALAPGAATTTFGFQATRPNGDTAYPSGYACA